MRSLCAIRTNRWDENAERLFGQLGPVFGDDLVVVFHDRPADAVVPLPAIDINRRWVRRAGLARPLDWGWRCGDYFYYRLREARPDYDQYWLIEPDVYFRGDVAAFFAVFAQDRSDMLTCGLETVNRAQNRFARQMPLEDLRRAIFALTRFSGPALDYLVEERLALSAESASNRFYPHDELFSMSYVCSAGRFSHGDMKQRASEWFATSYFDTAPDILVDALGGETASGVFHPVHELPQFKAALVKRLAKSGGFLPRMGASLSHLRADDAEEIIAGVAASLRAQFSAISDHAPAPTHAVLSQGAEVVD